MWRHPSLHPSRTDPLSQDKVHRSRLQWVTIGRPPTRKNLPDSVGVSVQTMEPPLPTYRRKSTLTTSTVDVPRKGCTTRVHSVWRMHHPIPRVSGTRFCGATFDTPKNPGSKSSGSYSKDEMRWVVSSVGPTRSGFLSPRSEIESSSSHRFLNVVEIRWCSLFTTRTHWNVSGELSWYYSRK